MRFQWFKAHIERPTHWLFEASLYLTLPETTRTPIQRRRQLTEVTNYKLSVSLYHLKGQRARHWPIKTSQLNKIVYFPLVTNIRNYF